MKRKYLYDFGVSQDDPQSELRALQLIPGDRVLCIASAGEVPLELLVNSDPSIVVDAVDIAPSQLMLSNLKLRAALTLETDEVARFLGYLPSDKQSRENWFQQIKGELPEQEVHFWQNNAEIFEDGPIHLGRYETYIALFAPLGRMLLGGKHKIRKMFECKTIQEQKTYFDTELRSRLLKNLFKVMFDRRLYKNKGVSEQGLMHMGKQNLGITFYNKFRDFCTRTPVRENWILQFVLFNQVLHEDALPSYLLANGRKRLRDEYDRLNFIKQSYTEILQNTEAGTYNKFALSNVSDWLSDGEFAELMDLIINKSGTNARGLIRYIHSPGYITEEQLDAIELKNEWGTELLEQDRFPFYNLIPFQVNS